MRFVVNTHYHLDHVNGNDIFAAAGAVIVAHHNVRTWMRTQNLKWWGMRLRPEDKSHVQSLKLPDLIYDDGIVLFLGRRAIEVRFLQGHTGGDSVVRVADASIICCGDLLWRDHIPNLIDASTQQWIMTLNFLRDNYSNMRLCRGMAESPIPKTSQCFVTILSGYERQCKRRNAKDDPVTAWSMMFCPV